jgi:hypothetical protein
VKELSRTFKLQDYVLFCEFCSDCAALRVNLSAFILASSFRIAAVSFGMFWDANQVKIRKRKYLNT